MLRVLRGLRSDARVKVTEQSESDGRPAATWALGSGLSSAHREARALSSPAECANEQTDFRFKQRQVVD